MAFAFMLLPKLTLVAVLAGPPAFWMIHSLGRKMHKASRRALESWSLLLGALGETLQGIRVVKAYTMEGSERRRFFRINRKLLKQQNRWSASTRRPGHWWKPSASPPPWSRRGTPATWSSEGSWTLKSS